MWARHVPVSDMYTQWMNRFWSHRYIREVKRPPEKCRYRNTNTQAILDTLHVTPQQPKAEEFA